MTVVLRSVVVRIRNKVGLAEGSNLTTFDCFNLDDGGMLISRLWLDLVLRLVAASVQSFN